jgi:hypothetical protein
MRRAPRKLGVSDRYGRSFCVGQGFHFRIELVRARLDDTRAQPSFCLRKDAIRSANAIVGDRKLPIQPCGIIPHDYLTITLVVKCMLQRIHYKFCDDQAEALGVTRIRTSSVAAYLQGDRPNVANHGGSEALTQL